MADNLVPTPHVLPQRRSSATDKEVVMYQLNHGQSKFSSGGVGDDEIVGPVKESVPVMVTQLTKKDINNATTEMKDNKIVTIVDLHDHFHSARSAKHRLSKDGLICNVSHGLTSEEALDALTQFGRNEIEEKVRSKLLLFLDQFTAPMPIGLWIAISIEIVLQNWADAIILLILQIINGTVGFTEANKAGNAVAALKATLKPLAQVKRDDKWLTIDAGLLVPGDCITLASGSAVPADCMINEGSVSVDQSSLTGETLPVRLCKGGQAKMGSTISRGEVEATVYATGMLTFYGKTAALLNRGGESLGELQKLLLHCIVVLLGYSVVLCGITLAYLIIEGENLREAIGFVDVLMVASIPVAMEVVVTATLALGSRELSEHKAIVAHLSAIERLSGMTVLCSDKTGTLTLNKMMIQEECPVFKAGTTRNEVLLHAALAAKWKEPAKDALDTMVLNAADLNECNSYEQLEYIPFDASLKRTESRVADAKGIVFRVTKGAPHVLVQLCHNKDRIQEAVELAVVDLASRGVRTLAVAKTNAEGQWFMLGMLAFLDPPRPDSKATIKTANEFGVIVKMITGDHQLVAVETSKALELGSANIVPCIPGCLPTIDLSGGKLVVPDTLGRDYCDFIMSKDGFSQALPEHKYIIVEALKQSGYIVGMTGDGVNDAPALKISSVGIAVHGATDAARAAADIVLTTPGLNAVVEAIIISRRIFVRLHSFLVYRIAATFQLLTFFFCSVLFLHPVSYNANFPQFWSMPVLALIVITVLNDGTIVSIAYDNAVAPKSPQTWQKRKLWGLAACLGFAACISSLILLHLALNAGVPDGTSLYSMLHLSHLTFGQVVMVIYLKVSLSDFMTIFAARTGPAPFYSDIPSKILLLAACFAVMSSTLLSLFWPFGDGAEPLTVGWAFFVWCYCILFFFIQDAFKVIVFKMMARYEISGQVGIAPVKGLTLVTVHP